MQTPISNRSITHQRSCRPHRRGFTLVELLVVIVIIVVLASLSFFGFNRFRDYSDRVNSSRNLSQIQLANALYASDHNGRYVNQAAFGEGGQRSEFWYQNLAFLSYLTGGATNASGEPVRAAPSEFLDPKVYRAGRALHGSMAASYGMNQTGIDIQRGPDGSGRNVYFAARISNPSSSMAFATATDQRVNYNARFNFDPEEDRKTSDGAMAYRHNDKALIVYFDGHIGEMTRGDIEDIDDRGGVNSAFWNPVR